MTAWPKQVLGEDIRIEGRGRQRPHLYLGHSEAGAYVVLLPGSKGEGALHVTANEQVRQVGVESMILDGPDGGHYDLLHHTVVPGENPSTSI